MKILFICSIFLAIFNGYTSKKILHCHPVDKPVCPSGEIYQAKGPGPFCYSTCCGPRGPPCTMDTFTSGCFCADSNMIKVFPVVNNTFANRNNPCVSDCSKVNCRQFACAGSNEEWRGCGPTSSCDPQVCRGRRPACTKADAAKCVPGCFCKAGYSRYKGECIAQCPLLP